MITTKFCPDCGTERKEKLKKPEMLRTPNIEELKDACQDYINMIDNDEVYNDDRASEYMRHIAEIAIVAFFGKHVFEYVVKRGHQRD
jgi:tRNA-dihydrouridine synthase